MADQGSPDAMGRQARDRPPNRVIDRPNGDIARATAIAPSLRLLGLGLPPGISPTAPAIGDGFRARGLCDLLRLRFFYLRSRCGYLGGQVST